MENGQILKHSRKKLDWTQQDMADYFGVQQPVICDWEQEERTIPEGALKMAKQVQRMSKKTAIAHYILLRKKSQKNSPIAEDVSKCHSLYSLEGKTTPKTQVAGFSEKFTEDSMESYILEAYITFKRSTGHFPTAEDFVNGASKVDGAFKEITQKEVLRYFGKLSIAKKLAGELKRSQTAKRRKRKEPHALKAIEPRKNIQTAITYIDPNDKYNWLRALYPERDLSKYKSKIKVKERTFTWNELFKYRPESERLVVQIEKI